MLSFRIFGIPVRVEPWFWLTMLFIGGGLHASDSLGFMLVGIFALAGFISILVHELGHALTIRKFGLPTSIALVAFGGFATYPQGVLDRKQSFLVSGAGPALQFCLGLSLVLVLKIVPIPPESLLHELVWDLMIISIIWSIFNCLPIYPMDGGQLLAAVLGPKRQRWVFITGATCAILIGIASYVYRLGFILPIFMALLAWKNWQDFQNTGNRG